ncbi:TorF family putative porin [Kordiimonas lacus]|uniref:Outer membrane protein beta-barrel domain-containing protein n=1 Tax=Kordiimonas lacus TaxID=637679 RepID=A0A1G6YJC2_9PROT|nr:TorF family putative porin [Kordiimonas lacus]SDD90392.1 conserved hypothetical protein [Kordiimonas lacus]
MKKTIGCLGLLLAASTAATAQEESSLAIDGYVGVLSDYRDRGLSLSDKDPVIVASVGAFHDSGFYGGVVGGILGDGYAGKTKAEFYAGYQMDTGTYIYDFSAELDSFHGDGSSRFLPEFKATMARDFGLAFIRGGMSYAPDGRWSDPDRDSFYVYSDLEVPIPSIPELTLIGRLGYDMRQNRSNVWDWGLGVSAFIENVELSVMYEDSGREHDMGEGALVFGARFYF